MLQVVVIFIIKILLKLSHNWRRGSMATHGHLGEFDNSKEDCKSYIERLMQYFTANDIENPLKQRAIFLSVCGASTYQLIKDVLAPRVPTEVEFGELVELMTTHLQPPPSETVQHYLFIMRRPYESIATYVAELNKHAEHCKFGATLD